MIMIRNVILCCFLLFNIIGKAQSGNAEIRLSELFSLGAIHLYDSAYLLNPGASLYDTIRVAFHLINDTGQDTTLLYFEGDNEFFGLIAVPMDSGYPVIRKASGRYHFGNLQYDYLYFRVQPVRIDSGAIYAINVKVSGKAYREASPNIWILTEERYQKELPPAIQYQETNFIISYIFLGAIGFGFFFFFFLFLKSKYSLYGLYALFLFVQALYGFIEIDVYTILGHFLIRHDNWDDFLNEFLAFTGQGVYVQFLIYWLSVKAKNRIAYKIFNSISIFFFTYAVTFVLLYAVNRYWIGLDMMMNFMRVIVFPFQLIVFYLIIFRIKSDVKSYVITGSVLLIFFGVVMVFLNMQDAFENTIVEDFDNGSWYMVGVLAESICFALGLGLRYFKINQENIKLQEENMQTLQEKLVTEQDARQNERKLAELNLELTNQQLTALRAQMNPHFIFNALNSIQKYILKGNVDEANSYLSKFSKLQRMILSYCDENFITLDKEINMLQLYLELEQLRLTDDFTFAISVDEDIEPEEVMIPPMMLQPFTENAIWHGLVPKEGVKHLSVRFSMSDMDVLTCIVEDNGVGRIAAGMIKAEKLADSTASKSKGMSLVFNRLAILERKYGKIFSVEIRDKMDKNQDALGTVVELHIPVTDS
ncbi:MAG TPA: histidine kinase [Saprospiraceae bacterium]|nr:histidine kinase [Saprospiraceae bacterium]